MKVLLVLDRFKPEDGGSYVAVSELSYSLFKKKIETRILHNNYNQHFFNKSSLKEIISKYDIVHIFGIWSIFIQYVTIASKEIGKKVIVSPIGYLEKWSMQQSRIKKRIALFLYQKKNLEKADCIHVTSASELNSIKDLNLKNKNIISLEHGKISNFNENLKIKKKSIKTALFFSRIHKKKGLMELVEAWAIVRPKNWKLEIVGPVTDLKYKKNILRTIVNQNLQNDIFINEPVYTEVEKINILQRSDLMILPSKNENFAFSICESLFAGLPVVCSDQTPWTELNKLNAGWCVDLSSVVRIAEILKKITNLNDNNLFQISNNAKNYSKKFNLETKVIDKYISMYKNILVN
jgi:glycosyltransferase involved in cell wall biosynthesis